MENFDVVVVGAGTGGCATAIALAQKGIKVALVDRKKKEDIGKKVCGDATSYSYFDRMAKEGCKVDKPKGDEVLQSIEGAYIASPNNKTFLPIDMEEGKGCIVNRHVFGQRLLHNAEDAGAVVFPETHALDLVIKDEHPQAVTIRREGKKEDLRCKVIVDCSGVSTALRRKVVDYSKEELGFEKVIDDRDMVYGYREIRKLTVPLEFPH
ncbi:MAG: NAD(P)/FAD-dependent oxidoreductase, partial [Candidatus Hodarchaeota archaeon]